MDKHDGNKEVSDIIYFKIKNSDFRKYYNFYGTSGCKAKEYIKYASNDILSIGDAQDKAIDDANMVVDEFNSFAKSVTVVTSY